MRGSILVFLRPTLGFTVTWGFAMGLGGCGLTVPDKDPFTADTPGANGNSPQGIVEDAIVAHVKCEIRDGLLESYQHSKSPWLLKWGTSFTLTLTFQDQSGLNPGISLIKPYPNAIAVFPAANGGNVVTPQSFSLGLGISGSATAQRVETVQFTYSNLKLLRGESTPQLSRTAREKLKATNYIAALKDSIDNKYYQVAINHNTLQVDKTPTGKSVSPSGFILVNGARVEVMRGPDGEWIGPDNKPIILVNAQTGYPNGMTWSAVPGPALGKEKCTRYQRGLLIESDLKIKEFIYDKITVASVGGGTTEDASWAQFNTFTETIMFTVSYGGNVTPVWKLARITADTSSTLLSATRTNTSTLIITIGPIQSQATPDAPAELKQSAQNQHNAAVTGTATASGINGSH